MGGVAEVIVALKVNGVGLGTYWWWWWWWCW